MKNAIVCILALLTLSAAMPRTAHAGRFGLGLVAGDPSGLSWKLWTTRQTALDGCFGWSFWDRGFTRVHVDYLWHSPLRMDSGRLWLYCGLGGAMWLGHRYRRTIDDSGLGVRGVLGLEHQFHRTPFSIYGEAAPTMNLTPAGWFDMEGGLGFRVYF